MEFKEMSDKVNEFHKVSGISSETSPLKMFEKGDVDFKSAQERYKLGQAGLKEFYEGNVLMDVDMVYRSLVNQLGTLLETAHIYGLAEVLEDGFKELYEAKLSNRKPDLEKVLTNHLNK